MNSMNVMYECTENALLLAYVSVAGAGAVFAFESPYTSLSICDNTFRDTFSKTQMSVGLTKVGGYWEDSHALG
jgi:hypothetical protein